MKPLALLACLVLSATTALAAPNLIGMNMPTPLDWEGSDVFADAFRTARDWQNTSGGACVKDTNGWPAQDCQIVCWHGAVNLGGQYHLEFSGKGDVAFPWGGSISGKTYDATSDTTRAYVTPASSTQFMLRFTGTSNGVRNVRLWRPGYHAGTNMFTSAFMAHLKRYSVLRFMDWLATNWNKDEKWSDRLLPHQHAGGMNKPGYGWQGRGTALELAIQMCNEAQKDIWVCLPVRADDNYITNFALVLRDGANGYPGLDTNLIIYVEYSNENWNGGFGQFGDNYSAATNEVAKGGSPLNFDGSGNTYYWGWRRVAKRGAEISMVFRHLFGDSQMMTRIRPVLMTQQDNGQATLAEALAFMEGYYNSPARVAVPRPATYYFYGAGGSGYYSPNNSSDSLTIDSIWTDGHFAVAAHTNTLITDAKYALSFGLKRICYEGGPGLDNLGHSESVKAAAVNDPRMRPKVVEQHDAWSAFGGDLFVYFTLFGNYQWGFTEYVNTTTTPKLLAIDDLNTAQAAPLQYGTPLPGAMDGKRFSCFSVGWQQPGAGTWDFVPDAWAGYVTRVTVPGPYRYIVRVGANTAASFEFFVDGMSQGTVAVPATGVSTPSNMLVAVLHQDAGLHSFRITGRGGTNRVHQITTELVPEPSGAVLVLMTVATASARRTRRGGLECSL